MESLADNRNGTYAYVDDLTSSLQVIALDIKVQVDFSFDVVAYYNLNVWSGVIGYENWNYMVVLHSERDYVYLPDIGIGSIINTSIRYR